MAQRNLDTCFRSPLTDWIDWKFGPDWRDKLEPLALRPDVMGDLATFVLFLADEVRELEEELNHD